MSTELIQEQFLTKYITLLQALAAMPAKVAQVFTDVDEAQARRVSTETEWSMVDVVEHLIDVDLRYRTRFEQVVVEDNPFLYAIWPDETAQTLDLTVDALVKRFQLDRFQTVTFLESCSLSDWQRPATHEIFGETNFRYLVQNMVDHDALHLNQLIELKQRIYRQ